MHDLQQYIVSRLGPIISILDLWVQIPKIHLNESTETQRELNFNLVQFFFFQLLDCGNNINVWDTHYIY